MVRISDAMKIYIFQYSLKDLSVLIFGVFCSAHLHHTQLGKIMNKGGIGCE